MDWNLEVRRVPVFMFVVHTPKTTSDSLSLSDLSSKDALYLDTSDSRFGKMAECGQMVKVGFVSDVDGLYFHKRFKGSGHPFYDSVYKKAAKVDKLLADHMDTCIVK